MKEGYSVEIYDCTREIKLSAKEKIRLKDFTSFPKVEELLKRDTSVKPVNMITLDVHN